MTPAALILATLVAATPSAPELVNRAVALRAQGLFVESLELMRQAYALDPSPVLLNNIGSLLEALGRYREAVATYEGVLSHPATPPELIVLDRQRVERLSLKLAGAWLRLESKETGAEGWVDGVAVELGVEVEVPPGAHRIELWTPRTRELRWLHQRLPSGELTTVVADAPPDWSRLEVDQLGVPSQGFELDGYHLRGLSRGAETIVLSPGHHTLYWRTPGEAPLVRELDLAPGARHRLADDPSLRLRALPLAAVTAPPVEASAWPLVALGAGAALLGAGGALGVAAGGDRDAVRNARRDPSGVITGLSYAQAGALEAEANTKANAALTFFLTGSATFAVGALWWLLEHHALD
jgi:tetratricopeptide (TPR) repeat protein